MRNNEQRHLLSQMPFSGSDDLFLIQKRHTYGLSLKGLKIVNGDKKLIIMFCI